MKNLHANSAAGVRLVPVGLGSSGLGVVAQAFVMPLLRCSQPYPSDFMFIDREVHGEALGDG